MAQKLDGYYYYFIFLFFLIFSFVKDLPSLFLMGVKGFMVRYLPSYFSSTFLCTWGCVSSM